jgi:hypothetical protein
MTLRWLGVLPAAMLAWIAVDLIVPAMLNVLVLVGSLVRLSPVLDLVVGPTRAGEYVVVLGSYAAAVLAAWKTAPCRRVWAASTVAILFLLLRVAMTYSVLAGSSLSTDSEGRFILGTVAAVCGVAGALIWIHRSVSSSSRRNVANPVISGHSPDA